MPENVWPKYQDRIAGVWKTVSYELFDGSGPDKKLIAKPHGDSPLGRVQISPNAYLSAHMARPDRMKPLPSGKTWQEGEDAEVAFVARGESMYCGYFELFEDDDGLWWQTKVDVSTDPNRMGGMEVRRAALSEEGEKQYMTLQPKNDMVMEDGRRTRGVLKWEKIE
ncbi:hypothetical protein LTR27_004659 [Elasticomyces elasticus]|nr:hypothetical protein LTR27_004659 [Elasticomyces elasticus]